MFFIAIMLVPEKMPSSSRQIYEIQCFSIHRSNVRGIAYVLSLKSMFVLFFSKQTLEMKLVLIFIAVKSALTEWFVI